MVQERPFSGNTWDLSADPDRSRALQRVYASPWLPCWGFSSARTACTPEVPASERAAHPSATPRGSCRPDWGLHCAGTGGDSGRTEATSRQFGGSSSLLLPLQDNSVSVHHYCKTIRCQFIIIASLADNSVSADNSVAVHHYCFPCIKSVSWIHGKTSKTDETIRWQFIIIASLASSR